jgi:hypothetical protein
MTWSAEQLERLAEHYALIINPLVYSEVSVGFDRIEDLDAAVPPDFSPGPPSVACGLSRRQSVSDLPTRRRNQKHAPTRFLHRSPRRLTGLRASDPGCPAISFLLPATSGHWAGLDAAHKGAACPSAELTAAMDTPLANPNKEQYFVGRLLEARTADG